MSNRVPPGRPKKTSPAKRPLRYIRALPLLVSPAERTLVLFVVVFAACFFAFGLLSGESGPQKAPRGTSVRREVVDIPFAEETLLGEKGTSLLQGK